MEVLVDTSVWIDYFRSGDNSHELDLLIDEGLVITNDIILAELSPLLVIRGQTEVISLLKKLKSNTINADWQEIIDFQVRCLQAGSSGIGIPDLLIAQNAIQNGTPVYSLDKHFRHMYKADFGLILFTGEGIN